MPELKEAEAAQEEQKREDYRKQRPKKRIVFNLEENSVLEFRKEQIVKLHDVDLSSATRNQPATKSRLVKFDNPSPELPKDQRASVLPNEQQPEITPELSVSPEPGEDREESALLAQQVKEDREEKKSD